jgi:hypothetical protein
MEWFENVGKKLYMDTLPSPPSSDNLHAKTINCCEIDRQDKKNPNNFGQKMKLKGGDIKHTVNSNLMAIVWKHTQNVNIVTNTHAPPQSDFCGECRKTVKLVTSTRI